jgi:hypothetical protein
MQCHLVSSRLIIPAKSDSHSIGSLVPSSVQISYRIMPIRPTQLPEGVPVSSEQREDTLDRVQRSARIVERANFP